MRRLIINADDLGLTPGVNRAILKANEEGVVTSTTLMANGNAFADAVACVRSVPASRKFSVGCHLVLVDGTPISPPATLPSLMADGDRFRRSISQLAVAARSGELSSDQIEAESKAQFRAIQNSGITLSHFDAHKHSHMFPEILLPVLRAAVECGISAMRVPYERPKAHSFGVLCRNPRLWKRVVQVALLRSMHSNWRAIASTAGIKTPDGSIGIIATGDMNSDFLRDLLSRLPDGTWELVCHPGYDDADLAAAGTRLRSSRVAEFQLLTSPDTRKLLAGLGIELISYAEL